MTQAQRIILGAVLFAIPALVAVWWPLAAKARLEIQASQEGPAADIAVAAQTDAGYCSPELRKILRRVLESCGLMGKGGNRGCQPLEAKNVATVSGDDFNALFQPMRERGGIVQFDASQGELDDGDRQLIDDVFTHQGGASYFFVVARASPDGPVELNRSLSEQRAKAVMTYLETRYEDPDLAREVGLLWLGEEFAQLDREFCAWRRSGEPESCNTTDINRGAFVAWIDCRL